MAKINLTSDDLETLSRQLSKWKAELDLLNRSVQNRVKMMDSWRDPQFAMFLNGIEMTAKQIGSYSENMERMAKSLKMYANQQKEMNATFRSNISGIR